MINRRKYLWMVKLKFNPTKAKTLVQFYFPALFFVTFRIMTSYNVPEKFNEIHEVLQKI